MRGLEGNFQAQPRVFAHDAIGLTPGATQIANTTERGCCLYVGVAMSVIQVIMEGGTTVNFKGVAAGSFLPILVTHVTSATLADGTTAASAGDIVALF